MSRRPRLVWRWWVAADNPDGSQSLLSAPMRSCGAAQDAAQAVRVPGLRVPRTRDGRPLSVVGMQVDPALGDEGVRQGDLFGG